MWEEAPTGIDAQISKGYARMLYKPISEEKKRILTDLYDKALAIYRKDEESRRQMAGEEMKSDKPEAAALVVVANAMLNLDEVVTKS
jgi:hypothetical protein